MKAAERTENAAALASRRSDFAIAASLYWGIANGDSGALRFVRGLVATQASNAGLNSVAEAPAIEVGELGLVARVRVHPLREEGNVDLALPVRQVLGARRLDARGDRPARRLGLLAAPARRLIGGPRGRHGRHRQQHGRRQLEVAGEAAGFRVVHQDETRTPRASHGSAAVLPTSLRASSRIRSDRSIATGFDAPDAVLVRVTEGVDRGQGQHDHGGRRSHQHRLRPPAFPAVGEEQHEGEDDQRDQDEHEPDRSRDDALRAVEPVATGLLAVGRLIEPLGIRGLLSRALRVSELQALETARTTTG